MNAREQASSFAQTIRNRFADGQSPEQISEELGVDVDAVCELVGLINNPKFAIARRVRKATWRDPITLNGVVRW